MEQIKLEVQLRKETGSGVVKRLRKAGYLPGVVYGSGVAPVSIKLMTKDFDRVQRQHGGESSIYQVVVMDAGKPVQDVMALLREISYNPVSDRVDHLDFQCVSMDQEVTVKVAIVIKGEAVGLKKVGATLEHGLRELEVIALPKDIPQHIDVDATSLDVHHAVHVKDLALPVGVRTKVDPDAVVIAVVFSAREETVAEGEAEAGAKPEVQVLKEKPKDAAAAGGKAAPAAGGKAAPAKDGAKK